MWQLTLALCVSLHIPSAADGHAAKRHCLTYQTKEVAIFREYEKCIAEGIASFGGKQFRNKMLPKAYKSMAEHLRSKGFKEPSVRWIHIGPRCTQIKITKNHP